MKKTISILFTLNLLLSILSITGIAKPTYPDGYENTRIFTAATLTDENGKIINTVYPGQNITLSFYIKTKQNDRYLKNMKTYICYDNEVLSHQQFNLNHAFDKLNSYTNEPLIKNKYPKLSENRQLESSNQYDIGFYRNFYTELSNEDKNLINSYRSFEIDTNLDNTLSKEKLYSFGLNQNDIQSQPTVSFKFKVKSDIKDGKKSLIMLPDTARHFQNFSFLYYDDYDEDIFEEIISNDNSLSSNTKIYFTVDNLSHIRNQIRFIPENNNVSDSFKFRAIVSIPNCVWNEKYINTATDLDKNKILQLGFVAAKASNKNFDDVKLSVEQNKPLPSEWKIGTTNTVYKSDINADAKFCCLLNISKSTLTEDIVYIPFIKYLDSNGKEKYKWTENTMIAPVHSRYEYAFNKYLEMHK